MEDLPDCSWTYLSSNLESRVIMFPCQIQKYNHFFYGRGIVGRLNELPAISYKLTLDFNTINKKSSIVLE